MSRIDWLLPLLLVQSVVRQLHGKRLSAFALAWPVVLVAWAGATYIRGFPPSTADLTLVVGSGVLGLLLGLSAALTSVVSRGSGGEVMVRATRWTVLFWTLGSIGRLVFALYATHGGGPAIARFSAGHHLTLGAWTSALTGMALAEVIGRTVLLLLLKARTARPGSTAMVPATP